MQTKQRSRIYYTETQKALMWERWNAGESLQQIAQLFERNHSSVGRILAQTGGIRPAQRSRSSRALSLAEREEISRGIMAVKLQLQWSPEQIAGWLKQTYPRNEAFLVSFDPIYRTLFIQARGALKKELLEHLRRTRVMRRSRHHTRKTDNHGRITDTVSISERPALVGDRAVPGHWEGVLLSGSGNSHIATFAERHTRYVALVKLTGKDAETVANALIKQAKNLPQELYQSLTRDRGKEMADRKRRIQLKHEQ